MSRVLVLVPMFVFAAGCADTDEPTIATERAALSAAQCDYFAVNGRTRICHATGSKKNPYVVFNVSTDGCINGHARHAGDYVAAGDDDCNGGGCLPNGAPSDPTLACCEGLTSRNGRCEPSDRCLGVTCTPSDPCHLSTCDSATGQCVVEAKVDGFECDDESLCTDGDSCQAGACVPGAGVCQNGGVCIDGVDSRTCECPTGFIGADCETTVVPAIACPCWSTFTEAELVAIANAVVPAPRDLGGNGTFCDVHTIPMTGDSTYLMDDNRGPTVFLAARDSGDPYGANCMLLLGSDFVRLDDIGSAAAADCNAEIVRMIPQVGWCEDSLPGRCTTDLECIEKAANYGRCGDTGYCTTGCNSDAACPGSTCDLATHSCVYVDPRGEPPPVEEEEQ